MVLHKIFGSIQDLVQNAKCVMTSLSLLHIQCKEFWEIIISLQLYEKMKCCFIWVRSRNCGCLVAWFCYRLIAKPGNKTAAVLWPDPFDHTFLKFITTMSCNDNVHLICTVIMKYFFHEIRLWSWKSAQALRIVDMRYEAYIRCGSIIPSHRILNNLIFSESDPALMFYMAHNALHIYFAFSMFFLLS